MSLNFTTKGLFPGRTVSISTLGRFKNYGAVLVYALKTFVTRSRVYYWITGMRYYR